MLGCRTAIQGSAHRNATRSRLHSPTSLRRSTKCRPEREVGTATVLLAKSSAAFWTVSASQPSQSFPHPPSRPHTPALRSAGGGADEKVPRPMGSQHPSPNVKTFCKFEPQIWLEIITSRIAKSACFKGSRTSCREIIFGFFWPNFGQERSHHVMDASCRAPYRRAEELEARGKGSTEV